MCHYMSSSTTSAHPSSFTISRRQARLCIVYPSWRPRLCIGLLRVDFASSHWSIDCWPQLIYLLAGPPVATLFKTLPNNNYVKILLPESSLIHFLAIWCVFPCFSFVLHCLISLQILSLPLMVKPSVTIGGGLLQCQIRIASPFHLGAIAASISGQIYNMGQMTLPYGHKPSSPNTLTSPPSDANQQTLMTPSPSCGGTPPYLTFFHTPTL